LNIGTTLLDLDLDLDLEECPSPGAVISRQSVGREVAEKVTVTVTAVTITPTLHLHLGLKGDC
jgi:hypothetical protein